MLLLFPAAQHGKLSYKLLTIHQCTSATLKVYDVTRQPDQYGLSSDKLDKFLSLLWFLWVICIQDFIQSWVTWKDAKIRSTRCCKFRSQRPQIIPWNYKVLMCICEINNTRTSWMCHVWDGFLKQAWSCGWFLWNFCSTVCVTGTMQIQPLVGEVSQIEHLQILHIPFWDHHNSADSHTFPSSAILLYKYSLL